MYQRNDVKLIVKLDLEGLKKKAASVRNDVLKVSIRNKAGHIAPSLSCIEILSTLYYRIMDIAEDPQWDGRDRMVFSKAHGCYGVYSILVDLGYIAKPEWESFYQDSPLSGCIERDTEKGIEASCGALGHGLPMATGIAFGAKLLKKDYRVYCVVGDGEMQEGSNWEAVQFAVKHELSNLTVIIDNNGLQAMDFLDEILTVKGKKDHLKKKFKAFGFMTRTANGHDLDEITEALSRWKEDDRLKAPQVLIANTVKGYGLKFMENVPKFHFRLPTPEELNKEGFDV